MRYDYQLIDYASRARKVLLAYSLIADEKIPVELNSRLVRAFGRCCFRQNQITGVRTVKKIELQTSFYHSKVSDTDIISTLIHEYLHSLFLYDGHQGNWKHYAEYITATSCYNITATSSFKEFDPYDNEEYKYELYCPQCGMVMKKYKKITGMASHPQDYNHRGCHEKLKVRKVEHSIDNTDHSHTELKDNTNNKENRTYLEKPEQIRFNF